MSGKDDDPKSCSDDTGRISGVSLFRVYMDREEEISMNTTDENMDNHSPEDYPVTCNTNSSAEASSPRYEKERKCVLPHGFDLNLWKKAVEFAVDRRRMAHALCLVDKYTLNYLMELGVSAYPYDQAEVRK